MQNFSGMLFLQSSMRATHKSVVHLIAAGLGVRLTLGLVLPIISIAIIVGVAVAGPA